MKNLLIGFALLLVSVLTYAQAGRTITGKVTDQAGEPLPGVSIVEQGTTNGTITDIDGNYSVTLLGADATLVYSFIGFSNQELPVGSNTQMDVVLQEEVTGLDEVVVVGYGEMRRSDLTGSIAKVTARDEVARQYPSVDMLLQGRAAGVQVVGTGEPGSALSVRIRGANSLRGNNEPLYVVDGVIINSAGEDVNANTGGDSNELPAPQNGLTGLNASDIENIEVLKDASATAIYGSRGANGVVIITTKTGKSGEDNLPRINVYSSVDVSKMTKQIDVLDGIGYAEYQNEYQTLQGNPVKYHIEDGVVYPISDADGVVYDEPYDVRNWQDEIYSTGVSYNSGVSISGNSGKTTYYLSGAFSDQTGIVETNNIKRGDLRLNLGTQLSNKLKLDTRISLMFQDGSFANGGSKSGGTRSFTKQVLSYRPLVGTYDPDADLDNDLETSNPYSWLTDYKDLTEEIRSNVSTTLTYEIIKDLKYKFNVGVDYRNKERSKWYGTELFKGKQQNGVANYSFLKRYSYLFDHLLTYKKRFNNKHRIELMGGITYEVNKTRSQLYEVSDFAIPTLEEQSPQNGKFVDKIPLTFLYSDETIQSFISRATYNYRDRYIFTATFRSDKASKFAPGNQVGYFPSGSFAWRAAEEPFVKNLNVFDNLKFRAGWGITGNQAVQPYQTLATFTNVNYVDNDNSILGYVPERIPNKDLTWETTEQINFGIDMAFFNHDLRATVDVYQKNTRDLLQQAPIGPSNGFDRMWVNRGELENKGIELAIDGTVFKKHNWTIDLGGHIAFNKGKIKDLGLAPDVIYENGVEKEAVYYLGANISTGSYFKFPANIFMEGQEVGMFWGHETRGVYAPSIVDYAALYGQETADKYATMFAPGDMIIVDHNDDGSISDADKTFIGNPNPDFTYGINLNVSYKNVTLTALFDGVYGNDIINGYNTELAFAEGLPTNILSEAYEQAWRADAPSTRYPALGYRGNQTTLPDVLVEDGSYFRLSNVTLSYQFKVKDFAGIESVNLYATGRNLFTLTNYSGYNPQITSFLYDGMIMGVDWVGNPNIRTYLMGINIAF